MPQKDRFRVMLNLTEELSVLFDSLALEYKRPKGRLVNEAAQMGVSILIDQMKRKRSSYMELDQAIREPVKLRENPSQEIKLENKPVSSNVSRPRNKKKRR